MKILFTYFVFVDSHVIGLLRTWFLMKICMASSMLPPFPMSTTLCNADKLLSVESILCMQIMFNSQFENENPQIEYYVENSNFIIHLSARLNVHHNQLLQKQIFPLQTLNCLCFFSLLFQIKFNFQLICFLFFFCAYLTCSFFGIWFFFGR